MNKKTKVTGWDFDKSEQLIELVRNKPELYDLKCPRYSDNICKRNAWNEIGSQLNVQGSECKERWESLRSQYRKNENKQKTKSGQAASNISNWKYASQMHFLKQFMKDRSRVTSMTTTTSNDSDEEKSDESTNECEIEANNNEQTNENNNEENVDEDVDKEVTQTSSLKTPKLRKKITHTDTKESASTTLMKYLVQQKREEQPPHPIDTFFSLIATSVKKFNATDQHFVKTQLFSLVSDIEAKYIVSKP